MVFRDINNSVIRIPDSRLCGAMRKDKCLLWCAGDQEGGDGITYEVSDTTFRYCMRLLGEEEV